MKNSLVRASRARTTSEQRFWGRSLKGFGIAGIGAISLFLLMAGCADDGNGAAYSGRVTNLQAYAGHNSIWVHWTAPSDNQFQGVIIEYTKSGGSDITTDIITATAGQDGSSDVSADNGTAYTIALYAVDKNGNRGAKQSAGSVTPGRGVALDCGNSSSGGAVANRNRNGGAPELGLNIRDQRNTNNRTYCLDAGRSGQDASTDLAQLITQAISLSRQSGGPFANNPNQLASSVNVAQARFVRSSGSGVPRFIFQNVNIAAIFGSSGTRTVVFNEDPDTGSDNSLTINIGGGSFADSLGAIDVGTFNVVVNIGN